MCIDAGGRIFYLITGYYHFALKQHRRPVITHPVQLCIGRHPTALSGICPIRKRPVYHPVFERGGRTKYLLGNRRILYTGQLNDNALPPLLLDNRLCYTEFVDSIAQGNDILLQRRAALLIHRLLSQIGMQKKLGGIRLIEFKITILKPQQCQGLIARSGIRESNIDATLILERTSEADFVLAQYCTKLLDIFLP